MGCSRHPSYVIRVNSCFPPHQINLIHMICFGVCLCETIIFYIIFELYPNHFLTWYISFFESLHMRQLIFQLGEIRRWLNVKIIWWYEWLMHLYFSTARIQKYFETINKDTRWSEYRLNSSFFITYAKWLQSSININLLYLCHWRRFGVSSARWCGWQWIRDCRREYLSYVLTSGNRSFFSFQEL